MAMLDATLEISYVAFFAAYPELWLEDEQGPLLEEVPKNVHRLLDQVSRLRRAIARYQAQLEAHDDQERTAAKYPNDMPF